MSLRQLLLFCMSCLGSAGLLWTPGCGDRARSTEPAGRAAAPVPRYGGEFHMMLEAPGSLDPALTDDVYEACIVNQIYDGLLEFDVDLNPVPAIAREWHVSRDGTEYEFVLRDDVRFHNGRPVAAEDFVYSFTRLFDRSPDETGTGAAYLRAIEGAEAYAEGAAESIAGLTVGDDGTLRIRLDRPHASFLSALAMDQTKVVPREEVERWGDEFGRHPCGTGPFRFEREVADASDPEVHLVANADYFRGRPYLDRVVIHVPRDFNVDRLSEELLDGSVMLGDVTGGAAEQFETDPRFRVIRRPELSFSFIGMNLQEAPFGDVRVRQAIAHAIDRERIRALDPAGRTSAGGILTPGLFGSSPDARVLTHDLDAARRLLAEAGYPEGHGPLRIAQWQPERGQLGRKADEILRESLAEVGIEVEFRYMDWSEFEQAVTGLTAPSFGLTWVADVPDPESFLGSLFATDGGSNLFAYSNPVVDSLLAVGSAMSDSRERAAVYRRVESIVLDDAPVVPLYHLANTFAVRAGVHGLAVTPLGAGNLALERVWIDGPPGEMVAAR